ncbi:MAG: DUF4402 domain-containing protein [Rhodospirillales bacterium]|nr:DUF4402 domain-containing protein [Rhodospirillales bacterium]
MSKRSQKTIFLSLSALALAGGLPDPAAAQSLNCPQMMIFGDIIPCASANAVTVRPDGSRNVAGCLSAGGAPYSYARCVVTQTPPLRPIQISVAASPGTISNGTTTMTVNNFNLITNGGGKTATVTAFFVNVPIGAAMNVGSNQATGTYTGTFTVNAVLQ